MQRNQLEAALRFGLHPSEQHRKTRSQDERRRSQIFHRADKKFFIAFLPEDW